VTEPKNLPTQLPTQLPTLVPRPVAASVDELLDGATRRTPMGKTIDSKSGSTFERVEIGGERYVLKHLHVYDDWLARATGDLRCRPLLVWQSGLLDALPSCLDHAVVGAAGGLGRGGLGATLLLRDVGNQLVAEGGAPLRPEQHAAFVEHMAELHARFWGWTDQLGLQPLSHRLYELSPTTGDVEAELGGSDAVPPLLRPGWERLLVEAPAAGRIAWDLFEDPGPLLGPLEAGPSTLVHGDWKAGNLGTGDDGRTLLLDWAVPGAANGLLDLAWYLAVNCDLLPEPKESAVARYREALVRNGISTDGWWDAQLALALIVGFVQLGWNKSGAELAWWADRVVDGARYLA
jgi:Phosphotransferase enzyme family